MRFVIGAILFCWLASVALAQLSGGNLPSDTVPNTTTLKALPSTIAINGGVVRRTTDGVAGAPPMDFRPSSTTQNTTPCTLNGGNGDGASQVPTADGNCWYGIFPEQVYDVREFGVLADTATDQTAAMQNAANAAGVQGGQVLVPAVANQAYVIIGTIALGNNVYFHGTPGIYYPGMIFQVSGGGYVAPTWPPASGTSISCVGQISTNPTGCIWPKGIGDEIAYINWQNPQPTPPSSGTFTPVSYPFIIHTDGTTNWNGIYIHDLTFTSADKCMDLEGSSNYAAYGLAGAQGTVERIWFNGCLQTGIRTAYLDNTWRFSNFDFDFDWYRNNAPVGNYITAHALQWDACYLANAQIDNIEFSYGLKGMNFTNCTVTYTTSPLVQKTFAAVNLQIGKMDFNEMCQGFGNPNANAIITGHLASTIAYLNAAQCSGSASGEQSIFFDLQTTSDEFLFGHAFANGVQTLIEVGPGAIASFDSLDIVNYSTLATGGHAFLLSATGQLSLGGTDYGNLRPFTGAGTLTGPGPDSTQGYIAGLQAGGGANSLDGGIVCSSGGDTTHSGLCSFYYPGAPGARAGYIGYGISGTGINVESDSGNIYLNPPSGAATAMIGGGFIPPTVAFASLPTCNTAHKFWVYEISDGPSTPPAYLANVTSGGGTTYLLLICNGANWQAH